MDKINTREAIDHGRRRFFGAAAFTFTAAELAVVDAAHVERGVQIELCGATAAANHWGNADLLPGVNVNTNAMVRVTGLEQKGFTLIYE